MFRGFYNLTSGMLSQGRRLDVIANNMTNVATAGYKADRYTDSTFEDVLISRVGNKEKNGSDEIGTLSYMLAPSQMYTDHMQGSLEETGLTLDFAIEGDGYFAIESAEGRAYTRAGNFALDQEGYLCLPGQGRVLDTSGAPIRLNTDKIAVNHLGEFYTEQGAYLGRLGVFSFADNTQLTKNAQGLWNTGGGATPSEATIHWKTLERSNVDLVQQMMEMMSSQRALQSAAQMSKMYDQIMTKATTELGRI